MKEIEVFKNKYTLAGCTYDVEVKSTMGVGGIVSALCEPETVEQIIACKKAAKASNLPLYVCGNLSNTIILDGGYHGVIMRLGDNFSGVEMDGSAVRAKSGTSMIKLAKKVTEMGLGGLEFAGGIPGTVGGGVRMNAGAYGGQMSDVIRCVKYLDGETIVDECSLGFGYRTSKFCKNSDLIILEVEFALNDGKGDMDALREFNRRRKEKQPLDKPNCGSVFKRPEGHFVGKLVDDCGLRGAKIGGAMVSDKHSGFIINAKDATATDVITLMEHVRATVKAQTGIALESEWVIIGEQ